MSDYSEIETFDSINDVSQLDNYIVSKKPDIILMDINLKNISPEDGLELAKQILIEQNRCAMACQGCGAAFFFSIIK